MKQEIINQPINSIDEVNNKIIELKNTKRKMQHEEKKKKYEDRKIRLKSNNNDKSNVISRIGINLKKEIDDINEKRIENGFDELSIPKITDLITKHIKCWKIIKTEIIHYNTSLDPENEEAEFNDK